MTDNPPIPGLYLVVWAFANSTREHWGTAKWTGKIWIAENAPGGAIIISWKEKK